MESNYVSLCVTQMTPDGNYLATTPTGKEVMILRNDISIRGPGKFPENFVNQTLKAVPLEVQQDGYDLYSPWIYENDLLDEMAGNLANGTRNTYDAELAYIGYADGYLLFKINQGILGCVTANRFSMSGLCDFNLMDLERGMRLPVTVLSIDKATGRIPCSTLATFGSFEENVAALGLEPGAEVTGLVTGYLPANPNQLVVMLAPNIFVLIDANAEFRIGMNVKLIVEKVDRAHRKVRAAPKQPFEAEPAAPWKLDPFVSSPPAWVDNEAFFQQNRVRKKTLSDITTIPPGPAKSSPPPDGPNQFKEESPMYKRRFLAPPTLLVGPCGVGKMSLLNTIFYRRICAGPTFTNRPPRALDTGGDFLHISAALLDALIKCGACTDDVSVTKFYSYATCHAVKVRGGNRCPLFITNIETATMFRRECPCHIIQVLPGNAAELAERLDARHEASPELIKERLKEAQEQIMFLAELADFTIINSSDFSSAIAELENILDRTSQGTACYTHHRTEKIQHILDSFDDVIPRVTNTDFPIG